MLPYLDLQYNGSALISQYSSHVIKTIMENMLNDQLFLLFQHVTVHIHVSPYGKYCSIFITVKLF